MRATSHQQAVHRSQNINLNKPLCFQASDHISSGSKAFPRSCPASTDSLFKFCSISKEADAIGLSKIKLNGKIKLIQQALKSHQKLVNNFN